MCAAPPCGTSNFHHKKKSKGCARLRTFLFFCSSSPLVLFLLLPGKAFGDGPRLENLDDLERHHAEFYWNYTVCERVEREHAHPSMYKYHLPLADRLAGVTYAGHAARLRLALEKARRGEPLRVGALGGSITAGQGVGSSENTYFRMVMDWINCAMPVQQNGPTAPGSGGEADPAQDPADAVGGGDAGSQTEGPAAQSAAPGVVAGASAAGGAGADGGAGGSGGAEGAASRASHRHRRLLELALAVQAASPSIQRPRRHRSINGAVPGTESSYTSSCLHHHLIPEPDLIFVDYAVNDLPNAQWKMEDPPRHSLERLIRKLLRLPSRPAVVLVNMWAWGPSKGKYWHNAERDFMEFATYYSLPAVSLKAAVLPRLFVGTNQEWLSKGGIWNGGLNHPGRGGHVVVAELLITMFTGLLRTNIEFAESEGDGAAAAAAGLRGAGHSFLTAGGAAAAEALAELAVRPLPPPLAEGNYETMENTCYIEAELQALVQQPVVGWNWTDEGRGKWGYVARGPGNTIRLKVSTQLVGERPPEQAQAPIILQIAYLQSYRGMGTARATCVEGCSCNPVLVDAYDARQVSLTMMKDITVTQHPECVIELTSGKPSKASERADAGRKKGGGGGESDGAAKFKLMGVVVGEEPGAKQGSVEYVRGETNALWQRTSMGKGALMRPA